MAGQSNGRREAVNDPLAITGREQRPDRSLALQGVRPPSFGNPLAAAEADNKAVRGALGGLEQAVQKTIENKQDEAITAGKTAFLSGVTEQEIMKSGNRYTQQGYQTLAARDTVNKWFTNETIDLEQNGRTMDPAEYQASLMEKRKAVLDGITDPYAKRVAVAAFEEFSPRLASTQMVANNKYNEIQTINNFSASLDSTAITSSTKSVREGPLKVSPVAVAPSIRSEADERDIGIRTLLGEAGGEGSEGMAAVAHVLRNRASSSTGGWPKTIKGVALQDKQFSVWNDGKSASNLTPDNPLYQKAAAVYDAVMEGRHVDPTGGATHYYSPRGMQAQGGPLKPLWFDAEAQKAGGQVVIGGHVFAGKSDQAGQRTEVQDFIRGYQGIKDPATKAKAVTDAMRRQLDAGDDSLFRDAGGLGMLRELQASPADIDEVIKAKTRFDSKRADEFSLDKVKFKDDILSRAEKGESRDALFSDIDKAHKLGMFDDSAASSLASEAASKVRSASKTEGATSDPQFMNELGGLYQKINSGGWESGALAVEAKELATKYGASEQEVKSIVGTMFNLDQQYQNSLRAETEKTVAQAAKREVVVKDVNSALARGYGLDRVAGERIPITNAHGQPATVTPQEYGVMQIKDRNAKEIVDAVESGAMDRGRAKGELVRRTYLELQRHDVVDKELQSQLVAGLSGNIIGKNGEITTGAMQAYEAYNALANTPNINPGYLARTVDDPYVRSLLETANMLDSGDLSPEQSLRKAHELLNDPNRDPEERIKKDAVWSSRLRTDIKDALRDKVAPGFWQGLLYDDSAPDYESVLKTNLSGAERYVTNRAEIYHMQNPNEDARVSMKKGIDDLQANATAVAGNLIITKPGMELHKTMGISGYGKNAPDDAVKMWLAEHGPTLWPKQYAEQSEGVASVIGRTLSDNSLERTVNPFPLIPAVVPRSPPVVITYDAESGIISFDMYKDSERTQTLGAVKSFRAKDIGAYYVSKNSDPGFMAKAFDSIFETIAVPFRK